MEKIDKKQTMPEWQTEYFQSDVGQKKKKEECIETKTQIKNRKQKCGKNILKSTKISLVYIQKLGEVTSLKISFIIIFLFIHKRSMIT